MSHFGFFYLKVTILHSQKSEIKSDYANLENFGIFFDPKIEKNENSEIPLWKPVESTGNKSKPKKLSRKQKKIKNKIEKLRD